MRGRCIIGAVCGALLARSAHAQMPIPATSGTATHAQATLHAVAGAPGRTTLLLTLRVDEGWHVSYRNPGDTGLPTRLHWSLPAGVSVIDETWPVPTIERTDVGVTHILSGEVPWLIEFTSSAAAEDRLVSVTLRYGVCRDVCIPAQLTVQGVLPGAASAAPPPMPAVLRTKLIRDGGVLAARRLGPARLCVARAPWSDAAALPVALADTTVMLPVHVTRPTGGSRGFHGLFMNGDAPEALRHGAPVLFVHEGRGVRVRLDLRRPIAGCPRA